SLSCTRLSRGLLASVPTAFAVGCCSGLDLRSRSNLLTAENLWIDRNYLESGQIIGQRSPSASDMRRALIASISVWLGLIGLAWAELFSGGLPIQSSLGTDGRTEIRGSFRNSPI